MINLKKARDDKGLSHTELAEAVGVIRQSISNIECGINRPSPELAIKIGDVLEIDWTQFFVKDE